MKVTIRIFRNYIAAYSPHQIFHRTALHNFFPYNRTKLFKERLRVTFLRARFSGLSDKRWPTSNTDPILVMGAIHKGQESEKSFCVIQDFAELNPQRSQNPFYRGLYVPTGDPAFSAIKQ